MKPHFINSISELHRILQIPGPEHPLVSLINFDDLKKALRETDGSFVYNFYCVCIKKYFKGKIKYGQNYYDFDEGVMSFFSPGQVVATRAMELSFSGWFLIIHPDFIRNYPLSKTIKDYGFFSYSTTDALHLSEKEELMATTIMKNIEQEYRSVIDNYTQNVIVSHIELLLNYCDRFYNRQFITRKGASKDLLIKLEDLLTDYFNDTKRKGLPTVQFISEQLNVSPNYLSDMLRSLTGQNTQQHIHNKMIEKAKDILMTTTLSVSEIAYQLGFEYPQSFSKLFKNKTNVSPMAFRNSFN
jgi:AraC family transcriptional activator of pobA